MFHRTPFFEKQELSQDKILKILAREKSRGTDSRRDSLPENLTPSDRVTAAIIYILANEHIFKPYLVELDSKLRQALPECDLLPVPLQYVSMCEYDIPVMPERLSMSGERLTRALDKILLEQEQKHGVNQGRTIEDIPVFFGLIEPAYANAMVARGDLWNDKTPFNDFWMHGERTHRTQHYIVTRYLDDHPDYFKAILNHVTTNNIFRFLVEPVATHIFYNDMGRSRRHWHCALDDARGSDSIINCEPTLTGPVNVVEYVLERSFFAMYPYLANAQYHSICKTVFESAPTVNMSVPELFQVIYSDMSSSFRGRSAVLTRLNILAAKKFETHPFFTRTNADEAFAGIAYLKPLVCTQSTLRSGFFCDSKKLDASLKDDLYRRYAYQKTDNEAADLESILRRAAYEGNYRDVTNLVKRFRVNVNAQDTNPGKRKTAMHHLLMKAKTKDKRASLDAYHKCALFMAENGYDFSIADAEGKLALVDDKFNWLSSYVNKNPCSVRVGRNKA